MSVGYKVLIDTLFHIHTHEQGVGLNGQQHGVSIYRPRHLYSFIGALLVKSTRGRANVSVFKARLS